MLSRSFGLGPIGDQNLIESFVICRHKNERKICPIEVKCFGLLLFCCIVIELSLAKFAGNFILNLSMLIQWTSVHDHFYRLFAGLQFQQTMTTEI